MFSKIFEVRRGVIQGDIISPIFFILALDQLFQEHDIYGDGVAVGRILHLRVLGYADDAALLESTVANMTERLTAVADASVRDADMHINMSKTYSQHVQRQEASDAEIKESLTEEELLQVEAGYKHSCHFCGRKFKTEAGMLVHRNNCKLGYNTTEEVYELEEVLDVFGAKTNRFFLVKWKGYDEPEWERAHLLRRDGCGEAIRSFWANTDKCAAAEMHDDPEGRHRCITCGRCYKRAQDLKAHYTRNPDHSTVDEFATTATATREAVGQVRKRQQQ